MFYVLEGYWKALEIISVVQPIESFVTSKMSRDWQHPIPQESLGLKHLSAIHMLTASKGFTYTGGMSGELADTIVGPYLSLIQ